MMMYDVINGDSNRYSEELKPFTLGALIDVLYSAGEVYVRFVDTDYTIGELGSWRGSYDVPSITYVPSYTHDKVACQLAAELDRDIMKRHYGYKGGKYKFYEYEEFYVSPYGQAQEYKIIDSKIIDDVLVLYTKRIPY